MLKGAVLKFKEAKMVGSLPYWDLYKARENGTQAVRAVQNNDTSRTMVFSVSSPSS